jgi:hypothetical protein
MLRRIIHSACVFAVGLSLAGCDADSKNTNPSNLPYGESKPLPKRDVPKSKK